MDTNLNSDKEIIIYTDGACSGNQDTTNSGGYGAILLYKGKTKEIFGGNLNTTNNRMELKAVIKALENLKRYDIPVTIYSDSTYVVNGINKWIYSWINKNKKMKNMDLWVQLFTLKIKCKKISFYHVKGHNGDKYNEIADELAVKGSKMKQLEPDYENDNASFENLNTAKNSIF